MKRTISISVWSSFFLAVFANVGCQSRAGTEAAAAPTVVPAPGPKQADENVQLDPAMLSNIRVEQVRNESQRSQLTATGKVQFNEDLIAHILAPMSGQVLDFKLRVGDAVQKDQVLFSIKSREIASLVTDYIQSQRDQDLAEKTEAMTKDLFDHQAASKVSLQQAESDLAKSKAHVAQAEESLRVLGLDPKDSEKDGGLRSLVPVHSPASGNVIERNLTSGQFVQADSTSLLTIADLSSVWVMVDVFERDIHAVHPGQKVQVVAVAYPDRKFIASVDRVSDRVDPDTRTLKVRLLVPNPDLLLKPEMFISASVELNETTTAASLPASAIFTEGGNSYLFVAKGDKTFERRQVNAAPDREGRLRVTSGLRTGDRVVTDGALLLNFRQQNQKD